MSPDRPFVYTDPLNPHTESALFRIGSAGWCSCARRSPTLSNLMTSLPHVIASQPQAEPLETPLRHFITTTTMADSRFVYMLNLLISLQSLLRQYCDLFTYVVEEQTTVNNRMLALNEPQGATRRANRRQFWVRPGRTSSWWNNFIDAVVVGSEWIENFRMSRASLFALSEELCPYIGGQSTNMRAPIETVKKVALTLYYLSDEGRLRKNANAFGISRSTVSIIVRQVCKAIAIHLGPKYIKLPFTEPEAMDLVLSFHRAHGMPHQY